MFFVSGRTIKAKFCDRIWQFLDNYLVEENLDKYNLGPQRVDFLRYSVINSLGKHFSQAFRFTFEWN